MSWEYFRAALCNSIKDIRQPYFEVQRYGGPPVQRERVYCYELYHQLRSKLGDDYEFTLHAEIDKRGQEIVWEKVGNFTNPDFVIHLPGAGLAKEFQLAVIEVKSSTGLNVENLKRDLDKLRVYVEEVYYQKGIFLVFGQRNYHSSISKLIRHADVPKDVSIFWHDEVGKYPKIIERN